MPVLPRESLTSVLVVPLRFAITHVTLSRTPSSGLAENNAGIQILSLFSIVTIVLLLSSLVPVELSFRISGRTYTSMESLYSFFPSLYVTDNCVLPAPTAMTKGSAAVPLTRTTSSLLLYQIALELVASPKIRFSFPVSVFAFLPRYNVLP